MDYRVEEFHIPARRIMIPDPSFSMVDETFDNNQTLLTWKWGEMSERYFFELQIFKLESEKLNIIML